MTDQATPPEDQQPTPEPSEAMSTRRSSFVTREDELLQDASKGVADEPSSTPVQAKASKANRSVKKPLIALLIVAVLAGGGFAGWKILTKKSNQTTSSSTGIQTPNVQSQTANQLVPANVAYAYRASSGDAYTAYLRPAAGGDRSESLVGFSKLEPNASDVRGTSVAFATDDAIFASGDGGKSYKKIKELKAGEQVTSLRLSTDGTAIAYAFLSEVGGKNTAKSMDLQGKDLGELFSSDKAGIFIYQWNKNSQKIFYGEGCYNCDGNTPGDIVRDLKTSKTSNPVTKGQKLNLETQPAISDDFSTIVYVEGQPVSTSNDAGLGDFADPPYKVTVLDVKSGEAKTVATIGQKDAKNPNGTKKDWTIQTGFVAGSATPYYAAEGTLYKITNGTTESLLPTGQNIRDVYFVGDKVAILSTAKDSTSSDFDLQTFNISTTKNTLILQGDANTSIFGVVTK